MNSSTSPCIKTEESSASKCARIVTTPIQSKNIDLDMALDEISQ